MPTKFTRQRRSRKAADRPKKPYPDFPLSPHASGAWQKKIRGKVYYFGRWAKVVGGALTRIPGDGWEQALALYKAQADDLHAGRTPRKTNGDGLTVADLANAFLTSKLRKLEAGEITQRTFHECREFTDRLVAAFGKTRLVDDLAAGDFEALRDTMAKQWGPVRLGKGVAAVRAVFRYGYESGLIDKPMRFGREFKKPSKHVLRRHRAAGVPRLFEQAEIRAMLDAASPQLRAMILLGINAGFGNHDCGTLPLAAVNLVDGWIVFPRPKTGVERRCLLWPETIEALKTAIAQRPTPRNETDAGLVFITKYGRAWSRDGESGAITLETGKLLRKRGVNGRRRLGFYTLRHTFRTVADATRDLSAVRLIMGHADGSIDDVYRERIDDNRLVAVVEHVRAWLWPKPAVTPKTTTGRTRSTSRGKPSAKAATDEPAEPSGVDDRRRLRIVG